MKLEATLQRVMFWQGDKDARRKARIFASGLASLARGFCGARLGKLGLRPEKRLVLYEMGNCPHSRKVREALSILDLDADIRPCPKGERHHRDEVENIGGKMQLPLLVDPNTMDVLYDADRIVAHVFEKYGRGKADVRLRAGFLGDASSQLASRLRSARGSDFEPARRPALPLELWSYEASAESRLVREVLGAFAIPYTLHNSAQGSEKLAQLAARTGYARVPCLYDPNREVTSLGAGNAMAYLRETYGEAHDEAALHAASPHPAFTAA